MAYTDVASRQKESPATAVTTAQTTQIATAQPTLTDRASQLMYAIHNSNPHNQGIIRYGGLPYRRNLARTQSSFGSDPNFDPTKMIVGPGGTNPSAISNQLMSQPVSSSWFRNTWSQ